MLNGGHQRSRWPCLSKPASPQRWERLGWLDKKPDCPPTCGQSIPLWRGFRVHVELCRRSHPLLAQSPVYKKIGPLAHRATRVLLRASDRTEDPTSLVYSFREHLYPICEQHFKTVSSHRVAESDLSVGRSGDVIKTALRNRL